MIMFQFVVTLLFEWTFINLITVVGYEYDGDGMFVVIRWRFYRVLS